jgi:hypothetical protein
MKTQMVNVLNVDILQWMDKLHMDVIGALSFVRHAVMHHVTTLANLISIAKERK